MTTPNGEVPCGLLSQSCFYCPNLITVVPLSLELKRFVRWLWSNVITTTWGVPNGTLSMMFTCCPNLMFLASPWLEIYSFQTGHFADFERFKVDIHFAKYWASQNWPYLFSFIDFGQVVVILLNLSKTCHKKQSNKNSRTTHRIWHKLFSMIQSAGIKNWCSQSINRLWRFSF